MKKSYRIPVFSVCLLAEGDIMTESALHVSDALSFDEIERHSYTIGNPNG